MAQVCGVCYGVCAINTEQVSRRPSKNVNKHYPKLIVAAHLQFSALSYGFELDIPYFVHVCGSRKGGRWNGGRSRRRRALKNYMALEVLLEYLF